MAPFTRLAGTVLAAAALVVTPVATGVASAVPATGSPATGSPATASPATTSPAHAGTLTIAPAAAPARLVSKRSKKRYRQYVSLGDSWSADVKLVDGHGLPDSTDVPIDCAQSQVNYPKLLAAKLKVKVHRDATCGSATTDDFYAPQKLPLGGSNPPQFNRLTKKTDLVTVGIGGNDAGIAAAALDCLSLLPAALPLPPGTIPALPDLGIPLLPTQLPLGGCKERFTQGGVDVLAKAIKASRPRLVRALREIHKRSPRARVLMVDYLAAVPTKGCYPLLPMTESDRAYLYKKFRALNAMVKRAAKQGGAEFVDTYTPSVGHDVCAGPTSRYVEVVGVSVNDPAIGVPAHPNAAGARAQFRAVLKQVRGG
ncbi:hypothetical protein ASG90_14080 [Nocardioides sp. Soil797]|nr:hypothetical protein ASG90_14080 [Nocardioides sp. Soil797]